MANQSNLIVDDIYTYLKQHEEKDLLRFITCGNVDDGKSTLIGRLLHDSKMIYEDQLASIWQDNGAHGTTGDDLDLALLVDGLQSEREQGITIDVAYRYFSTDKRKFIITDAPGHEQYTRNMATGASTANLAVLLIDARHGLQVQTRRHSFICSLLGIKHFVVAINKMDLIDYSQSKFEEIKAEYLDFIKSLNISDPHFIPLSALKGCNIVEPSNNMPWYQGPPLLNILEDIVLVHDENLDHLRFPVQYVNRPNLNFRGYCGTVACGKLTPGLPIKALPSGKTSKIHQVLSFEGDLDEAYPGDAVTITLTDELDISRGDMLVAEDDPVTSSNALIVDIVWMSETPLLVKKNYYIKVGTAEVSGYVSKILYRTDINTLEQENAAESIQLNEIARCKIELTEPVVVDAYQCSRQTGSMIFIDRMSNATVGAGMVAKALGKQNIVWHDMAVNKIVRAERNKQKPAIIWFTGLSGSGKSSMANMLERQLFAMGHSTYLLDGDNVRHGLCSDLGFSDRDRAENIRRVGELAKLMTDAGLIVLASFISPFRRERQMVRRMVEPGEFIECYVDTPLSVCEQRDPKGLYKKARAGEISQFTGIDSPYEAPENPEVTINTDGTPVEELLSTLIKTLRKTGII